MPSFFYLNFIHRSSEARLADKTIAEKLKSGDSSARADEEKSEVSSHFQVLCFCVCILVCTCVCVYVCMCVGGRSESER